MAFLMSRQPTTARTLLPAVCWWRLVVFAESTRRRCRILFRTALTRKPPLGLFPNISVCILALEKLPGEFFCEFFSFFNKIQDGRQNPMPLSREPLHGFVSCLV